MAGLTKEQAIRMARTDWWTNMAPRDVAMFQLSERLLCMPFGSFREAVEAALGRGVFTHEFLDRESLLLELLGDRSRPTLEEILSLIPADKRLVIVIVGEP